MKRRKNKKSFLFLGLVFVLLPFALVSMLHLQKTFFVYRAAQGRLESAYNEKEYVKTHLENLQTNKQKQVYDSENQNRADTGKLKKIEVRGAESSPNKNRPFSKNEMRFSVIEQE